MGELDGKVAIVTGSARGIGEQVATKLSAGGASVVVADLDPDATRAAAAALPGEAVDYAGDLAAAGACDALIQTALDGWGRVDIIVNNAGYVRDAPLHKITDEDFQAMLEIHCVVPFRVIRAAAPHMREAAKADAAAGEEVFRKVVNVTSLAGVMGNAGQCAYAAGKAGVVGLTRSLAKEWGALKINVNAVAFGFIDTPMTQVLPEEVKTAFARSIALQRAASPSEAADGIYFLCSPASNYVHGQVLNVSGGVAVGMAG